VGNIDYSKLSSGVQDILAMAMELSPKKILVVGGFNSFRHVSGPSLVEQLSAEIQVVTWHHRLGFVDNSEASDLLRAARAFNPDLIIGIGGGVSMDYAKIASGWLKLSEHDIQIDFQNRLLPVRELAVHTLLVPSLFGSGAEATFHAVVYFEGRKYSQQFKRSNLLKAVLIPTFSDSSSRVQRVASALDAICQGVETAWSTSASQTSRELALEGLASVLVGLEDYIELNPSRARDGFVLGANFIGEAMNTGKTTAPHAFSYFLTSRCSVPHGFAVGLLFQKFWTYAQLLSTQKKLEPPIALVIKKIESFQISYRTGNFSGGILNLVEELLIDGGIDFSIEGALFRAGEEFSDFLSAVDNERISNSPFKLDDVDLELVLSSS
jgi:alcohol dehydrogenase class IV